VGVLTRNDSINQLLTPDGRPPLLWGDISLGKKEKVSVMLAAGAFFSHWAVPVAPASDAVSALAATDIGWRAAPGGRVDSGVSILHPFEKIVIT
jgi:hypothetical protein